MSAPTRRATPATSARTSPSARRTLVTGIALAAVVSLAACTGDEPSDEAPFAADLETARSTWALNGATDYTFALDGTCGARSLDGRYVVTVEGGKIVAVDTEAGPRDVDTFVGWGGETIDELLARLDADPTAITGFVFDPASGAPGRYELDPVVDAERCGSITGYRPAG
ncbi:hypothetical protein CLV28_2092 [Sediminihabitans luteus]|uniref:Uncharacterized protein n=1 Tax=Sediminihabitans luteus TaxID=1138585 RepID=A0A2M9CEA5_9CELL|nr:DUF6174 domain-containing protein [Sediminihabitans luteus]PJJ70261.1 hypothetical protein CLV28_2092 [Sediminihabitans luteus]GII97732.1 hypothetical protein Slu03_01100 [Sediminihabitans luteus]